MIRFDCTNRIRCDRFRQVFSTFFSLKLIINRLPPFPFQWCSSYLGLYLRCSHLLKKAVNYEHQFIHTNEISNIFCNFTFIRPLNQRPSFTNFLILFPTVTSYFVSPVALFINISFIIAIYKRTPLQILRKVFIVELRKLSVSC